MQHRFQWGLVRLHNPQLNEKSQLYEREKCAVRPTDDGMLLWTSNLTVKSLKDFLSTKFQSTFFMGVRKSGTVNKLHLEDPACVCFNIERSQWSLQTALWRHSVCVKASLKYCVFNSCQILWFDILFTRAHYKKLDLLEKASSIVTCLKKNPWYKVMKNNLLIDGYELAIQTWQLKCSVWQYIYIFLTAYKNFQQGFQAVK